MGTKNDTMDQKIKNYLGIAIIATLGVFSLSLIGGTYVFYQAVKPTSFRSFSVVGEGKITAIPDVAQFTFSVITEGGKDLDALQKQNTEKMNKAIEFVKGSGVEAKDIKTQSYDVQPRYQYYSCPREGGPCPPADIVGYIVSQMVLVKVRDFTKAGGILAGAVQNGANSVSQLTFTIDDPTAVQNEARNEAIRKAKEKAEGMAEAGGFRLGKLISISEQGANQFPRYYDMKAEVMGSSGSAPAPTIEPGSQDLVVNVTLNYEIK